MYKPMAWAMMKVGFANRSMAGTRFNEGWSFTGSYKTRMKLRNDGVPV